MHRRFPSRLLVAASAGLIIAATTAPMAGAAPAKAGFKTTAERRCWCPAPARPPGRRPRP